MIRDTLDTRFLEDFERELDPLAPERGRTPVEVLGYGEISTVIAIETPATSAYAFKRMPMFRDVAETAAYEALYEEYIRLLEDRIGVRTVPSRTVCVGRHHGMIVMYIVQERLAPERVAQRLIPQLDARGLGALLQSALTETHKVHAFNAAHAGRMELAVDGQISNWALRDPAHASSLALGEVVPLDYLDTSTPLLRKDGREQLDTELFLRSAPSFLRPLLRAFAVQDTIDRYYDLRRVAIDMVANFYKEQRADVVPSLVQVVNAFLGSHPPHPKPISEKEVRDYYRSDANLWRAYLGARKADRRLRRLVGRPYPYILPDHVQR